MKNIAFFSQRPIFAAGLRSVIAAIDGFTMAAVWSRPEQVAESLEAAGEPGILMVDGGCGMTLELLASLKDAAAGWAVVLLTDNVSLEFLTQAVNLGVRGVLRTTAQLENFRTCIAYVSEGGFSIEGDLSNRLLNTKRTSLTPRQRQLMSLLAQGLKNKEIAWKLGISEGTVKVYLSHLFAKVGAADRFELALIALRNLSGDRAEGMQTVASAAGGEKAFLIPELVSLGQGVSGGQGLYSCQ